MERPPAAREHPPAPDEPAAVPVDPPASSADSNAGPDGAAAPQEDLPARERRRGDWLLARLPFLVAAGIGLYFAVGAYDLELGTMRQPDTGLWPFIVAVLLIVFSVGGIFTADRADIAPFGRIIVRPLLGLIVLCLFVVLFDEVGLLLTASLVLLFWFRVLAREGWLMSLALAVGASAVAHLLFVVVLGARLPADVIAQLWGGR
ncbi:tripartite tricarboxylate transporter TctB family protein [Blastococcus sp. BMG 814]|uniref:Tripartite tricarboxylate transporter TctB family protein n=1 Tax=Blastococcus carthaginiensis TaxID=3050034 RepID=A0ABT9IEA9_9ACTN|nr:tripartite tricarboxylate transporter TctB family protein [Blastococcus carthaginiensis]MDP5183901.1 tripartite tricarboxylate transporter TctB family protein [Blastococcus carthaginiensis]